MASQTIKYESTTVEAQTSVSELSALIRRYGGSRFEQMWGEDGSVKGVRFAVRHPSLGEVPVSMTARTTTIERILAESGKWRSYAPEKRERMLSAQSERVAWRHLKDLTEQLLLAVRLGLKTLPEAFLADVEVYDPESGEKVSVASFIERRSRSVSGGPLQLDSGPLQEEVDDNLHTGAIEMPPIEEGR